MNICKQLRYFLNIGTVHRNFTTGQFLRAKPERHPVQVLLDCSVINLRSRYIVGEGTCRRCGHWKRWSSAHSMGLSEAHPVPERLSYLEKAEGWAQEYTHIGQLSVMKRSITLHPPGMGTASLTRQRVGTKSQERCRWAQQPHVVVHYWVRGSSSRATRALRLEPTQFGGMLAQVYNTALVCYSGLTYCLKNRVVSKKTQTILTRFGTKVFHA